MTTGKSLIVFLNIIPKICPGSHSQSKKHQPCKSSIVTVDQRVIKDHEEGIFLKNGQLFPWVSLRGVKTQNKHTSYIILFGGASVTRRCRQNFHC